MTKISLLRNCCMMAGSAGFCVSAATLRAGEKDVNVVIKVNVQGEGQTSNTLPATKIANAIGNNAANQPATKISNDIGNNAANQTTSLFGTNLVAAPNLNGPVLYGPFDVLKWPNNFHCMQEAYKKNSNMPTPHDAHSATCSSTITSVSNGFCAGQRFSGGDTKEKKDCLPKCGSGVLAVSYPPIAGIREYTSTHYVCACWNNPAKSTYFLTSNAKATIYQAQDNGSTGSTHCSGWQCPNVHPKDEYCDDCYFGAKWTDSNFPTNWKPQNYHLPDSCPSTTSSLLETKQATQVENNEDAVSI